MPEHLFTLQTDSGAIRTETLDDVPHTVIPVVALVEGVIQCAICPNPELVPASEFGKSLDSWNGRPVTVNHPQKDGVFVPAGSPEVFETDVIGTIFNTSLDGGKLKLEAWLNTNKVEAHADAVDLVKKLKDGEQVEISTGYFADTLPIAGKFNGKDYLGVQQDIKPDHLALLTDAAGACSWQDGCGAPRLNVSTDTVTVSVCACGGECNNCKQYERFKRFQELSTFIKAINGKEISDRDRRMAAATALTKHEEDDVFVMAVFPSMVIYEKGFNPALFQRSFVIEEDGSITLGKDVVEVRPETNFVPIMVNNRGEPMKDQVRLLIDNSATSFAEEDADWLESLEDDQLAKLVPQKVTEPDPEPTPDSDPPVVLTAEEAIAQIPAEEVRAVLTSGLRMQRARRDELTTLLLGNDLCTFTEPELKGMSMEVLEKMAKMAVKPPVDKPNYGGRGGPHVNQTEDDLGYTPAPTVFEFKKKEA